MLSLGLFGHVRKLEFGGESPLTMRHELRRPKKTISRPVASIRSAYGIRQLEFDRGYQYAKKNENGGIPYAICIGCFAFIYSST